MQRGLRKTGHVRITSMETMMSERYLFSPELIEKAKAKGAKVEDADGVLTPKGMAVAHEYATRWTGGDRAENLETQYPELVGLFYDIRNDEELAGEHALPLGKSMRRVGIDWAKSEDETFVVAMRGQDVFVLPVELFKAGPYIGPRGGKWADPKHTIPWRGKHERKRRHEEKEARKKTPKWKQYLKGKEWLSHKEYRESDGPPPVYQMERAVLHNEIVNSFMVDKEGNAIKPPSEGVQKTAIVMMGGTASGKTSLIKHLLDTDDIAGAGFVNVNPDDVKEQLPEYNEGLEMRAKDSAAAVHLESGDVAADVYNRTIEKGLNMVLDGTGRHADKHIRKIKQLQENGYHIQLIMPDIDVQEAVERANSRADATGRYVPSKILIGAHLGIPGNFEKIAREADEFHLYNNRGGFEIEPQLKWSGRKGQEDVIHDEEWVQKFQRRGRKLQDIAKEREEKRKGKEMGKSMSKATKDDLRPAITIEEMQENLKRSKGQRYSHEGTPGAFPGAGKDGNGVEWPLEDFDYEKIGYDARESIKKGEEK
jgi:predicted ABC-type ATPase